jgi:MoxR-like ATPase
VEESVSWGAGPRASQYLVLGAKARALLDGRYAVSVDDIRALAPAVLQHRILTNFTAEAEGISAGNIISRLLGEIAVDEE